MKYLLCHGFGFSNEYWSNLVPLLDAEYEFYDDQESYSFEEYVGIGHSIGFQKLNNSGIKFKALIGLQGFLNFCGGNLSVQKNIDRMMQSFSQNKSKSLQFFYNVCKFTGSLPQLNSMPIELLLEDLESMKYSYAHCGCPTLILATDNDPVIARDIVIENFKYLPNIKVEIIAGDHHTLGFVDAEKVADQIKMFLNAL